MPARHLHRIDVKGAYCYIYNTGVEERIIFNDDQDYTVFLGYLEEYLTPPPNREEIKIAFTVDGETFQGTPHQPKNYFNKVELIAYNLTPHSFHLLLLQKTEGAIEGLLRSLGTRYSMYFNRRNNRAGTLFQGPYKSIQMENLDQLTYLTRNFHTVSNRYSSYLEYIEQRQTPWVKPDVVLSFCDETLKDSYKEFVQNNMVGQEDSILTDFFFEDNAVPFKTLRRSRIPFPRLRSRNARESPRIPKFLAIIGICVVFIGLSIRNIGTSEAKGNSSLSPPPSVSEIHTLLPEVTGIPAKRMKNIYLKGIFTLPTTHKCKK